VDTNENKRRKLLIRTKVEEELKKTERGVLNIQPFTVRSSLHSSSFSKCA
jgi:hypothetical protein